MRKREREGERGEGRREKGEGGGERNGESYAQFLWSMKKAQHFVEYI